MKKQEHTLVALNEALHRILQGHPKRIPTTRKLSVRAVEEEANMGNGSGYYYPDLIQQIKQAKLSLEQKKEQTPDITIQRLRKRIKEEERIKIQYRTEAEHLKITISNMAGEHHHLNDALRKALAEKEELMRDNTELREKLARLRRSEIGLISN